MSVSETSVPIVRAPGAGRAVGVLGSRSIFKVESAQTGGAYAILEQEILPDHGPPLHVHRHETEIFYILEGDFEIRVGEQKIAAAAGAMAVCPRDIPHTFRNVGTRPGRLLLTIIPGRFGDYFLEADRIPHEDSEAIRQLAARFDVEILE